MSGVPIGVQCERDDALRDAQTVCNEYGMPCTFRVRREGNVVRDSYGSVKERPTSAEEFTVGAFPYNSAPSQRQIEAAGLAGFREGLDCTIYTATQDWTDRGWTFDDIEVERLTVIAEGIQWRVLGKGNVNSFAGAQLHVTFALKRP